MTPLPFVALSIEKVVHTLIEAVVLVFVVMYLFLQNFRATIIPTIAVPVVSARYVWRSICLRVFN